MSTEKENTSEEIKEQEVNEAQEVNANKTAKTTTKKTAAKKAKKGHKWVKIDCDNAAGKYLLPYNKGQEVQMETKQAEEMIAAKDAVAL